MWATTLLLRTEKCRTICATGEVRALCASTIRRTPAPSKNAKPKPSLYSWARAAKPVKPNITAVGVLAFVPGSWHIAAARYGYSVNSRSMPLTDTRWPGLLVSLSTPLMRRTSRALRLARQISRSASHGWRFTMLARW